MHNTSANRTGLPTLQLAAALTQEQWNDLESFAAKRLRRSTNTPYKQRVLAIHTGRDLVHTAVEQFALGDLGDPGGRKLAARHRIDSEAFLNAMRAAINSNISHALDLTEFTQEHLSVGLQEAERGVCEPCEPANLDEQLELRDLEQNLFEQLEEKAGGNLRRQAAVEALRDDCQTGHARGKSREGVDMVAKNEVREQAQAVWRNLTLD